MTSSEMSCGTDLPLWRRVLAAEFDGLAAPVKSMFDVSGHRYATGSTEVEVGGSWLARLAAFVAGFPTAGSHVPTAVLFQSENGAEVWHRRFGRRRFSSLHSIEDGLLLETFGALTFVFRLTAEAEGVRFTMQETRLFGRALPRRISPRITALQSAADGRFRFQIVVELPGAGLMARLTGVLAVPWRFEVVRPRPALPLAA